MNGYAVYLLIVAFGVGWYLMDTGYFIYFRFRIIQTILALTSFVIAIIASQTEWSIIIITGMYFFIIRLPQEAVLGIVNLSRKKEVENDKEV